MRQIIDNSVLGEEIWFHPYNFKTSQCDSSLFCGKIVAILSSTHFEVPPRLFCSLEKQPYCSEIQNLDCWKMEKLSDVYDRNRKETQDFFIISDKALNKNPLVVDTSFDMIHEVKITDSQHEEVGKMYKYMEKKLNLKLSQLNEFLSYAYKDQATFNLVKVWYNTFVLEKPIEESIVME